MKPLDHDTLVSCLHQTSHDPYLSNEFKQALTQAAEVIEEARYALSILAVDDATYRPLARLANAAGLLKDFAKSYLDGYMPDLQVCELYECDLHFADALIDLIGPNFEYLDWSHKTVGEVLEIFK